MSARPPREARQTGHHLPPAIVPPPRVAEAHPAADGTVRSRETGDGARSERGGKSDRTTQADTLVALALRFWTTERPGGPRQLDMLTALGAVR